MKKKLKSLILTVFALALMFSFNSVSFASTNEVVHQHNVTAVENQSIVSPMATGCPKCGTGSLMSSTSYSEWVYNGNLTVCTSHYSCVIKRYERTATTTYSCTNCEYGYVTQRTEYDYRHVTV